MVHLPPELCHMIAAQLENDPQTLLSLLLASQSFLYETARVLYRTIRIRRNQPRDRLPLSNASRRSYYGRFVHSLIIESRKIRDLNLRPILSAVVNLKNLYITERWCQRVVTHLRSDYPFRLKVLELSAPSNAKIFGFLKSQPDIRALSWEHPMLYAKAIPSHPDLLPKLVSLQTYDTGILDSPWFKSNTSIRHLCFSDPPTFSTSLNYRPSDGSRGIVSLRLLTFVDEEQRPMIPTLFPHLDFLDVRYMEVSDISVVYEMYLTVLRL